MANQISCPILFYVKVVSLLDLLEELVCQSVLKLSAAGCRIIAMRKVLSARD